MVNKIRKEYGSLQMLLSSLLADNTKSSKAELIIRLLGEVQILGILVLSAMEYSKSKSIEISSVILQAFLNLLFLNQHYENYEARITLIAVSIYFILTLFFIIYAFFGQDSSFSRNLFLKRSVNSLILSHTVLISLYINLYLFKTIQTQINFQSTPDILIGSILLAIINNTYALAASRLCYCRLNGNFELAVRSAVPAIVSFFFKFLFAVTKTLISNNYSLFVLVIAFIYLLKMYEGYFKVPFFNMRIFYYFIIALLAQTGWIIAHFFGVVIWHGDINRTFYIGVILGVIFVRMSGNLEERLILRGLAMNETLNKKRKFYYKLMCYMNIFTYGQTLKFSEKYRVQELAYVKLMEHIKLNANPEEIRDGINKFISNYLNLGLELFNKDDLQLMKIYFELNTLNNPSYHTLINLIKLQGPRHKFDIRMLAYYLIIEYDSYISLKTKDEESVSITDIFVYYNSKYKFIQDVRDSTANYIKFWRKDRKEKKLNFLLEKSIQMSKDAERIACTWQDLKKIVSKSSKLEALCYSAYLHIVRNAPYSSFRIFREKVFRPKQVYTHKIASSVLVKSLEDEKAMTFLVEIQPDGVEKFIYTTKNIENFGFEVREILGKSVSILIPSIYKGTKRFSLLEHVEKEKGTIISSTFQVFLKSKNCLLYPSDCYICPIASEKRLLYVFLAIPQTKTTQEFVICENSDVEGWTHELYNDLNMKRLQATNAKFTIQEMLILLDARIWDEKAGSHGSIHDNHHHNLISQTSNIKTKRSSVEFAIGKILNFKPRPRSEHRLTVLVPNTNEDHKPNMNILALNNGVEIVKYQVTRLKTENPQANLLQFVRLSDGGQSLHTEDFDDMFENVDEKNKTFTTRYIQTLQEFKTYNEKGVLQGVSTQEKIIARQRKNYEASISNFTMMQVNLDLQIENSFYIPKRTNTDRLSNYSIIFYIMLSILLLMIFLISSVDKLDGLPMVLNTAALLYDRHNSLWQWVFFNSCLVDVMIKGLIGEREGQSAQSYFTGIFEDVEDFMENINSADFAIKKALPLFDPDLQSEFFQKFRVTDLYDRSKYEMMNLFEFDSRLTDYVLKLQEYKYTNISDMPNQLDILDYINFNTLNDQYIVEEYLYDVIKEEIVRKLDYLKNFSLANSSLLTFIAFLFYIAIFKIERKFIIKKTIFSEVLNKITEAEIDKQISRVERFLDYSQDETRLTPFYHSLLKLEEKPVEQLLIVKENAKSTQTKRQEVNKLNPVGLNNINYFLLFAIFMVLAIIIIISFGMQILLNSSSFTILEHVDDAIRASIIFNELCTVSVPLYLYVLYDGNLTVKNRPYTDVFNEQIRDLERIQTFYLSVLSRADEDLKAELYSRYTMDLCSFVNSTDCLQVLEPVIRNGALQMYAFVVKAVIMIKSGFDESNMSYQEKYKTFHSDNYINIEWASYYLPNTTQTIQNILQIQVIRTVSQYKRSLYITFFLFSAAGFTFLFLIWRPIWKELKRQRLIIYEMMKMVPLEIIDQNVYVKNFWNKFSSKESDDL